jgi:hypothetical protein
MTYIGTDPEIFAATSQLQIMPAHKLGIPMQFDKMKFGVGIASAHRDNWAIEFNTTQAYTCVQDVFWEIQRGKVAVKKVLPPGTRLVSDAAVKINLKHLDNAPADLMEFGCQPSYCAYDLVGKVPDLNAKIHEWRYAGGHLHWSTDNIESKVFIHPYCHPNEQVLQNPDDYPEIIRMMDGYVGLFLTFLYGDEKQFLRRKFYGQAGEFRPQRYPISKANYRAYGEGRTEAMGVEYRTPPPQVFDNEQVAVLAMSVGRWVIHNFPEVRAKWDRGMEPYIREAINTGRGVESLVQKFAVPKHYDFNKLQDLKKVIGR